MHNDYPTAIIQLERAFLQLSSQDFKAAKMNLAISYQHEALEHQNKSEYEVAESNYLLAPTGDGSSLWSQARL